MESVVLADQVDLAGWRAAARRLVLAGVAPEQIVWSVGEAADLFAGEAGAAADPSAETFTVPRTLVAVVETVLQARDAERFALLYALVWRTHHGERHIMEDAADPLVHRVQELAKSVQRDTHKMRAFLRFREVAEDGAVRHVAWFEPEHYILEANAPFFVRRFASMTWSILTPYRSAHWDGSTLRFGPGASPDDIPDDDALAAYWRVYYSSIFNPARLKIAAMTREMPKKYWRNMPETEAIPELIRMAQERTRAMVETPRLSPARPVRRAGRPKEAAPAGAIGAVATEAASCRRCGLYQFATQTVFGEGPVPAAMMLVGEQPGDQEDLAGRPFVGPAGQVLDGALAEAGIDRLQAYVSNAVKHFKFEPRGKRRIHAKPNTAEIDACRWWLDKEFSLVDPLVIVLLGASAAQSVLHRTVTISRERGKPLQLNGRTALVTVHPSYLLRLPDEAAKAAEYARFVEDLRLARTLMG